MAEEIQYIQLKEIKCPNCAGEVQFDPSMQLSVCIHCGSKFEIEQPKDIRAIAPDGIIPFNLTLEKAKNIFLEWLIQGNYTPDDILSQYSLKTFSGVYLPFYSFDRLSYSANWNATSLYARQESYTENETRYRDESYTEYEMNYSTGRKEPVTKHRQVPYQEAVTRTRTVYDPRPSSGKVSDFYGKPPLFLATSKQQKMNSFCEGSSCSTDSIKTFHTGYILGFGLEPFTVSADSLYENRIKANLNKQIDKHVTSVIPGDRHENVTWHADIKGINNAKKYYLPYWNTVYSYKGKQYQCIIDGQAHSRIEGEKPEDKEKKKQVLMFFVPLIIFLLLYAAIIGIFNENIMTSPISAYVLPVGGVVAVTLAIVGFVRRSRLINQSEKMRREMLEKIRKG